MRALLVLLMLLLLPGRQGAWTWQVCAGTRNGHNFARECPGWLVIWAECFVHNITLPCPTGMLLGAFLPETGG